MISGKTVANFTYDGNALLCPDPVRILCFQFTDYGLIDLERK